LRLSEQEVVRLIREQGLPARQAGSEWRFLKSAVQDWLRVSISPKSNKDAWMELAGSWAKDPFLDELLKEIYQRRGWPMTSRMFVAFCVSSCYHNLKPPTSRIHPCAANFPISSIWP
jgi:excisionase family DNA binding protein